MRAFRLFVLFAVIVVVSTASYAKNQVVVRSKSAKVYEKASVKSDVLYTLRKGNNVHILGVNKHGWAKVKINLDGNFGFTGWMFKSSLGVQQTIASTKTSKTSKKRVSDLEKFFEPTQGSKSLSPRVKKKKPKKKKSSRADRKKSKTTNRRSDLAAMEPTLVTERLNLILTPAWTMHSYDVTQVSGNPFSYSVSGMTISGAAHVKAPPLFQNKFFASVILGGSFGLLTTSTNLRDGSGNQFANVKAKNKLYEFNAKLHLLYDVHQMPHGSVLVGPTVGYTYMKFKGDDIVDDNGLASGLYITNARSSMLIGLRAEVTSFPPFKLIGGIDFGLNNKISEEPDNFTGLDAKSKTLYAPYISLHFPIVKPHQFLGIDYRLHYQQTEFTGDASQERGGVTLTDATVSQIYHFAGLTYTFQF